jgi:hypothetical protein
MDNETPPPPTPPIPPTEPPDDPFDEPSKKSRDLPPLSEAGHVPVSEPPAEPASQSERPRRGGARDRYERRKQQATPKSSSSRSSRRQITVPQNLNIPKIPGGNRVLIGVVGAIVFVVLIVYVLGRVRNSNLTTQPNALWLGTEWTYDDHTDDQIADLVKKLRDRHIGTVYAYVSYLQFNGTWRNEDKFDKVTAFAKQFKQAYPEGQLYGLIGIPTSDAAHPPRLNDVNLQQQVAALAKRVITDFGYQGVFIDAEPVWDGDQDYLALLRGVRSAVGIDAKISAAIPPDWSPSNATVPVPALMEPNTEWKKEYKQSVVLLVDQMVVMVFNSTLPTASDYSQWVAYQVKAFALAIGELDTNTDLLIGIPTFDPELPGHDPAVENIDSAVQGVKAGLVQAGDAARYVKGLAIYADWTTDDTEWTAFQNDWITNK